MSRLGKFMGGERGLLTTITHDTVSAERPKEDKGGRRGFWLPPGSPGLLSLGVDPPDDPPLQFAPGRRRVSHLFQNAAVEETSALVYYEILSKCRTLINSSILGRAKICSVKSEEISTQVKAGQKPCPN
ncbi:MAG: hypothetical protein M4579_005683 [Chaenotheca gracillima]|nr:MAG: hypothetical protein M4579_005683 [Chaenotheca gracillima]